MLYIDPGAGTLLLQALIATVAGAFFAFRAAITTFVRRIFGRRPPTE